MTSTQGFAGTGAVESWPSRVVATAGTYALIAGLIALAGWAAELPRLTDWKGDGISMFPNTAVCAALAGLALVLYQTAASPARFSTRFLALVVFAIAGLTLFEHASGVNLGIDTLLFDRPWGQLAAAAPMRMGPPATFSFTLAAVALFLLPASIGARRTTAALGTAVLTVGTLSLIGHLYGASQLYTLPRVTGVAMQTASVIVALGLGLVASVPEHQPMRRLLEASAGGVLTRQAFPLVVVSAVALGGVRVILQERGLVDAPFGAALRTVVEIGLLAVLLWWAAARVQMHEQRQRESDAEVRRQASQLAAFLETAAIALHRVGPDGTILWANDAELRILGYQREEYVGHHIAEFHADPDAIADILARLQRGEKLFEYPAQMKCKDGSLRHVLIDSSVLWEDGRFLHTQCFTRDVTERQKAEESRALLAAIVESSDDAIISKDLNGVITSWNRGAERVFGYTAAEAIGQSILMLIPPDRESEEPAILERLRRGESVDHYETVRRRKDGALRDISLTISPVRNSYGHVVGASKVARDITEENRGKAQREELFRIAENARQEAETANRAKDEFLAMLGHELRNPLSAVRNAVTAASLDEASRGRALEIARRQVDQLGRIVDDLLDVARITRGRVPLRKERVTLGEVLQRAVEGTRSLMDDRGHSLTLTLPAPAIHLQADPARIEQAMCNLLANAAKYTDPGGTISLTAAHEGEEAIIRVRDNGIGIAPEMLSKVFDLFAQGDRSFDRAQGGLGIGLTLVRRIIELHGGTVQATSPGIGQGSEFVVRLPAMPTALDALKTEAPKSPAHVGTQYRARVLMVEDNPDAAESLVMILELLGHHVRVVHDGPAGLKAAQANVPDLMLVDIGLPGMDGYEVARGIRSNEALKHLVLVALTGYGQPEDKQRAMDAGFDYHLVKPVNLDALAELVGRLGSSAEDVPPADSTTRH